MYDLSMIRRVGMLIPCTNTVIEIEFNRILPKHYQLHVARLRMGPIDATGWKMQDADIDYQSRLLGSAGVELIILAQTNAVFFAADYDAEVSRRMHAAASGAVALTAGNLIGQAVKALGARRIAFVSPYSDSLNELGRRYYESRHGIEFVTVESYGKSATAYAVGALKTEAATAAMTRANSSDVEAFVLAGGNFATLHAIADWERQFGKPVVTTNQCAMWGIFRALGTGDELPGYGRLLEQSP